MKRIWTYLVFGFAAIVAALYLTTFVFPSFATFAGPPGTSSAKLALLNGAKGTCYLDQLAADQLGYSQYDTTLDKCIRTSFTALCPLGESVTSNDCILPSELGDLDALRDALEEEDDGGPGKRPPANWIDPWADGGGPGGSCYGAGGAAASGGPSTGDAQIDCINAGGRYCAEGDTLCDSTQGLGMSQDAFDDYQDARDQEDLGDKAAEEDIRAQIQQFCIETNFESDLCKGLDPVSQAIIDQLAGCQSATCAIELLQDTLGDTLPSEVIERIQELFGTGPLPSGIGEDIANSIFEAFYGPDLSASNDYRDALAQDCVSMPWLPQCGDLEGYIEHCSEGDNAQTDPDCNGDTLVEEYCGANPLDPRCDAALCRYLNQCFGDESYAGKALANWEQLCDVYSGSILCTPEFLNKYMSFCAEEGEDHPACISLAGYLNLCFPEDGFPDSTCDVNDDLFAAVLNELPEGSNGLAIFTVGQCLANGGDIQNCYAQCLASKDCGGTLIGDIDALTQFCLENPNRVGCQGEIDPRGSDARGLGDCVKAGRGGGTTPNVSFADCRAAGGTSWHFSGICTNGESQSFSTTDVTGYMQFRNISEIQGCGFMAAEPLSGEDLDDTICTYGSVDIQASAACQGPLDVDLPGLDEVLGEPGADGASLPGNSDSPLSLPSGVSLNCFSSNNTGDIKTIADFNECTQNTEPGNTPLVCITVDGDRTCYTEALALARLKELGIGTNGLGDAAIAQDTKAVDEEAHNDLNNLCQTTLPSCPAPNPGNRASLLIHITTNTNGDFTSTPDKFSETFRNFRRNNPGYSFTGAEIYDPNTGVLLWRTTTPNMYEGQVLDMFKAKFRWIN